jgi:glucosamine kinase
MVEFLVGVDGGGSSTRALLARRDALVIGQGQAGPSALQQGIASAWTQVQLAIRRAFESAGTSVPDWRHVALGAGLSGISNPPWRDEFIATQPGFAALVAETDSFTMLVGAHGGEPGAIVIAGTGSIGEVWRADGTRDVVGGWGFPVSDEGSGAWLGLRAVRVAQAAIDGRANAGALARSVWQRCGGDRDSLQAWCDRAGQVEYGQVAPAVFESESADAAAAQLLSDAVAALEDIALALDPSGGLPLTVSGSIGERLSPRFSPALRSRLVAAADGPAGGALTLIRGVVDRMGGES